MRFIVVQDDVHTSNVFDRDGQFDEDGYLVGYHGEEGYHIDDMDIIYESNDYYKACAYSDNFNMV